MTRRIVALMVATTFLTVLIFGVPLAYAVESRSRDDEIDRLQQLASAATAVVPADAHLDGTVRLPAVPPVVQLAVYDASGQRIAGAGPDTADEATSRAIATRETRSFASGDGLVAVVPVNIDGRTVAAMRAAEPEDVTNGSVRRVWAAMALIALIATAIAVGVGVVLARRLVRPLHALRDDARRLGDGDFSVSYQPSGVAEIDEAGSALEATAGRLAGLVERERAFSANASHQLRTPATGLRTILEAELDHPRDDPRIALDDALTQVDRLETTIDELLALARDSHRSGPFALDAFLADLVGRWQSAATASGRPLSVVGIDEPVAVDASPVALGQVLDVLVDNALTHGRGTVTVEARPSADGAAISIGVADDGDGIDGDPELVFRRRRADGDGHGIGLALARSLTEAEGGRLLLARARPPELVVVVPAHRDAPGAIDADRRRPFPPRTTSRPEPQLGV